jgi:hypothetical protein
MGNIYSYFLQNSMPMLLLDVSVAIREHVAHV